MNWVGKRWGSRNEARSGITIDRVITCLQTVVFMAVLLASAVCGPADARAEGAGSARNAAPIHTLSPTLQPGDTLLVANESDAQFSLDYSPLLSGLKLNWVILEDNHIPEAIIDRHLILLGGLESPYSGWLITELLDESEMESLRSADGRVVIEKASPWTAGRTIFICGGNTPLEIRDAAEQAVREIMERRPPAEDWYQTRFAGEVGDALLHTVNDLRFDWETPELPLSALVMDVGRKPALRISSQEAAEDVERLFYLFSHGYAGYAFFNQGDRFEATRTRLLETLTTRKNWSVANFSALLSHELGFIVDCHLKIGDYQYGRHQDYWSNDELALSFGEGGYQFTDDRGTYTLRTVNGGDPADYVRPSLTADGAPVYHLGALSKVDPGPLAVTAAGPEERDIEVRLARSDFSYFAREVFREDLIGGIPVIRVRSFADPNAEQLEAFVATGRERRGEPLIIVDVRGNSGGNEAWPIAWIRELTGRRAEAVFVFSELTNATTMAGRHNLFAYLAGLYPDMDVFRADAVSHLKLAETFEEGGGGGQWTGPFIPQVPLIPNDTTVVVITNGKTASAGEGLVMRLSQAENVIVVGENTMGCLTFGNAGWHLLPHSRLQVYMPINFGLYLDGKSREEVGLEPDLWVPAADAVNYAVAAVRAGTIGAARPLSPETLSAEFIPEKPDARAQQETLILVLVIIVLTAAGVLWVIFNRHKPRLLLGIGLAQVAVGGVLLAQDKPVGTAFLLAGVIGFLVAAAGLIRNRKVSIALSENPQ